MFWGVWSTYEILLGYDLVREASEVCAIVLSALKDAARPWASALSN